MPDKYLNFEALARAERREVDYSIHMRDKGAALVVAAPHGGGIEPGTSEIARAIAGDDLSYYLFKGRKTRANGTLHITSSNFDEPRCLALLEAAKTVLTVHGEDSESPVVYIGGLHAEARRLLRVALQADGYEVRQHPDRQLQGLHPRNICNIGWAGRGVQLELSAGLRRSLFESLTRSGRERPTPRLSHFSKTVRSALLQNQH